LRTTSKNIFAHLIIFLILYSSLPCIAFTQNTNAFDSIYSNISINLIETDIRKAVTVADSLFVNSEENDHKMKSAMLLALIHDNLGKTPDAIFWATQAQRLSLDLKNYEFQVRSSGYLSTLYRRVNLTNESIKQIEVAEKANSLRKDDNNYFRIQSVIHHEKYYHQLDQSSFNDALKELDTSLFYLLKSDTSKYSFTLSYAALYESYAECYIYLKEFQKAKAYALKSLKIINNKDPQLVCLLNLHFGIIELHNNKFKQALKHLKNAEEYAKKSHNNGVLYPTYLNLSKYYRASGDFKNAMKYLDKADSINTIHSEHIKNVTNGVFEKLDTLKSKTDKQNKYLYITIVALISFLLVVYFFRRKATTMKLNSKYQALMKRIEEEKIQKSQEYSSPSSKNNQNSIVCIKTDTEERLIHKLKELEENNFFLNKELTLSSLATELNSNTKYISQVIKKHKNTDFNNYINELRIFYIINLWNNEPKSLKYKLSHIADLGGFSSHSRFSVVFKNVTGIPPSEFITRLKTDTKKS